MIRHAPYVLSADFFAPRIAIFYQEKHTTELWYFNKFDDWVLVLHRATYMVHFWFYLYCIWRLDKNAYRHQDEFQACFLPCIKQCREFLEGHLFLKLDFLMDSVRCFLFCWNSIDFVLIELTKNIEVLSIAGILNQNCNLDWLGASLMRREPYSTKTGAAGLGPFESRRTYHTRIWNLSPVNQYIGLCENAEMIILGFLKCLIFSTYRLTYTGLRIS